METFKINFCVVILINLWDVSFMRQTDETARRPKQKVSKITVKTVKVKTRRSSKPLQCFD